MEGRRSLGLSPSFSFHVSESFFSSYFPSFLRERKRPFKALAIRGMQKACPVGRGGGEKGRNFLTFSRKKETRTRPFPPPRPLCDDLVQTTLSLLTGAVVVVRGEKERIGGVAFPYPLCLISLLEFLATVFEGRPKFTTRQKGLWSAGKDGSLTGAPSCTYSASSSSA